MTRAEAGCKLAVAGTLEDMSGPFSSYSGTMGWAAVNLHTLLPGDALLTYGSKTTGPREPGENL